MSDYIYYCIYAATGETENLVIPGGGDLIESLELVSMEIPKTQHHYLMVQIVDPIGSADVLHDAGPWCGSFLAKVKPGFHQCQCLLSGVFRFSSASRLKTITMRFLNPDTSVFDMKGKSWSMTLRALKKRCHMIK